MRDRAGQEAPVRSPRRLVDGVVRVGPLMGVPAVLREFCLEPGPMLEIAGLTPAELADPDAEIPYIAGAGCWRAV